MTRKAWPGWLGGLLLILITILAYIPAFKAGFIWDDDAYVYRTDENVIKAADGLKRIWTTAATPQWYPLVFTTYWFEYRLWGFNPTGYHVVNILLHAFAAVLVWRILLRLNVPGAWLAAAIFAVHPVHVETVAWITERKNTLSIFFYMVALLAYIRFAKRDGEGWYWLALLAFVLALFSKTVTCTLPVIIILLLWMAKQKLRWSVLVGLIPFFIVGLFMGKLTGWYEFHKTKEAYWEPMPITEAFKLSWTEGAQAAKRSEYKLTTQQRGIIASRSLLFYAGKLVVPYPQAFFYHRWDESKELDTSNPRNYWPIAAVAGIGIVVIGLSVVYGRGIFVAFAFFVLSLLPALGFYDTYPMRYSFVADHFQYIASLGLTTLAAAGLALLFRRLGGTPIPAFNGASAAAGVLAIALIAALGAKTAWRCRAFANEETLWLDTIAKTPDAWGARVNLGILYGNKGNDRAADATRYAAEGNKAAADKAKQQSEEYRDKAAAQFKAILDGGKRWQEAPANLGNIYAMRRQFPEAEKLYRKAVEYEPRLANLYLKLVKLLVLQKKEKEAIAVYEQAGKVPRADYVWASEWPKLFEDWASLLEKAGQKDLAQAKRAYADALRKEIEATRKKPKRAPAPTAATPTATGQIDLGGATTPQDRRRAYLNAMNEAIARRDYPYAMRVILAGRGEFPTSTGLLKKYGLLIAASPVDELRDGKQAVEFAETLKAAMTKANILDADAMEVLAASYAEVGRFDEAVKAAAEGLRLAQAAQNSLAQGRLQAEIELYRARKPYRLPKAITPTTAPRPVSTQPAAATTRPIRIVTTRPTVVVTTRPAGAPATQPATR